LGSVNDGQREFLGGFLNVTEIFRGLEILVTAVTDFGVGFNLVRERVRTMRKFMLGSIFFTLLGLAGCAQQQPAHFAAETLELGYVKRVVVLPLENHTDESHAHERFHDAVTTEILRRGLFEVVEKGEAQRFLREELVRKEQAALDQATAKRLGQELNVQAYLAGAVEDFSERQNGSYSYPVVAATLRMVDVNTGQIIWQSSGTESGYKTFDRLFGFVSEDINQISYRLAQRLLGTIGKE
jgi:hypothetical protein